MGCCGKHTTFQLGSRPFLRQDELPSAYLCYEYPNLFHCECKGTHFFSIIVKYFSTTCSYSPSRPPSAHPPRKVKISKSPHLYPTIPLPSPTMVGLGWELIGSWQGVDKQKILIVCTLQTRPFQPAHKLSKFTFSTYYIFNTKQKLEEKCLVTRNRHLCFLSNENLLAKGLSLPLEHTADKHLPIGTKKNILSCRRKCVSLQRNWDH